MCCSVRLTLMQNSITTKNNWHVMKEQTSTNVSREFVTAHVSLSVIRSFNKSTVRGDNIVLYTGFESDRAAEGTDGSAEGCGGDAVVYARRYEPVAFFLY